MCFGISTAGSCWYVLVSVRPAPVGVFWYEYGWLLLSVFWYQYGRLLLGVLWYGRLLLVFWYQERV